MIDAVRPAVTPGMDVPPGILMAVGIHRDTAPMPGRPWPDGSSSRPAPADWRSSPRQPAADRDASSPRCRSAGYAIADSVWPTLGSVSRRWAARLARSGSWS